MKKSLILISAAILLVSCPKQKPETVGRAALLHTVADRPVSDDGPPETLSARELFIQAASFPVYGTITEDSVRLRSAASPESGVITLLMKNQRVEILERTAEPAVAQEMADFWYRVKLEDGSAGWAYGFFIMIDELEVFMRFKKNDRGVYMDKDDFAVNQAVYVTGKNAPLYRSLREKHTACDAQWRGKYTISAVSDTVYRKSGALMRFVQITGNKASGWIDTRYISMYLLPLKDNYVFAQENIFCEKVYAWHGIFIYDDLAWSPDGEKCGIEKFLKKDGVWINGFVIELMEIKDINNDNINEIIVGGFSFGGKMHSGAFSAGNAEKWMSIDEKGCYVLFVKYLGIEYIGEEVGGSYSHEYEYFYNKENNFLYKIKEKYMFEEYDAEKKELCHEEIYEWDGKIYAKK
ncbi:MAG: SH3 domain-containing protein [Spirochaetales bacterium]|nr:SH3 domain-containing protein [Spirochaetales bacterium]